MLALMLLLATAVLAYGDTAPRFTLIDSAGNVIHGRELGLLLYKGGTVCDDSFTQEAADAICKQMNYAHSTGWTIGESFSIQSNYKITLDDVRCSSAEWESCSFTEDSDCAHSEDVFLSCYFEAKEATRFTLVDKAGKLIHGEELGLLLYDGGTVCDDSFNHDAAEAICKQMNYTHSTKWTIGESFDTQSNYKITLDDVRCSSVEWKNCSFTTNHNCGHSEDVFLSCSSEKQGWMPVTRNVYIDHELEKVPLEIKTNSMSGSDDELLLYFFTSVPQVAGGLRILFSPTPKYRIFGCNQWTWSSFPTPLPSATEKIWRITLDKSEGVRLMIQCNGELVLNVTLSDQTCSTSYWSRYWSGNVEKIWFYFQDTASDYFRPYTGLKMQGN